MVKALNIVIRMEPSSRFPFNVRSFFPPHETKDIGNGIILCRGLFQSVRPAVGAMLVNLDISTGMMYKPGPLINLCLEFLGRNPGQLPRALSPKKGLDERDRANLRQFLIGVKVVVTTGGGQNRPPRTVKNLSKAGANDLTFQPREGPPISVANYFRKTYNHTLRYPDLLCVEVSILSVILLSRLYVSND